MKDITTRRVTFNTDLRQSKIMKENWSVGFIILELIFYNCGLESDSIKIPLETLCRLLENKDSVYLKFILDELFNTSPIDDAIFGMSFLERIQNSELFNLYQEYIDYAVIQENKKSTDKKVNELTAKHNECKINYLEEYIKRM